jgi:hypothetical protein
MPLEFEQLKSTYRKRGMSRAEAEERAIEVYNARHPRTPIAVKKAKKKSSK